MENAEAQITREIFGQVLRRKRKEKGWSQEDLAFKSGIAMRYVSLLECNKRQPTISTIYVLSQAFGILMSEFLAEIEIASHGASLPQNAWFLDQISIRGSLTSDFGYPKKLQLNEEQISDTAAKFEFAKIEYEFEKIPETILEKPLGRPNVDSYLIINAPRSLYHFVQTLLFSYWDEKLKENTPRRTK